MTTYETKQKMRKQRLLSKAEHAAQQSFALSSAAMDLVAILPAGQPIVENSHARKHRNLLDNANRKMAKAVELEHQAEMLRKKADSVGLAGISGDDPEALEKLREQLAAQESRHQAMLQCNKLFTKNQATADALRALGFSDEDVHFLLFDGGFCCAALRNSLARIKHTRERIAELETLAQCPLLEEKTALFSLIEDREENRFVMTFDGKPAPEIITQMKRHGFKWSPSRQAWVRQITLNARRATLRLIAFLKNS